MATTSTLAAMVATNHYYTVVVTNLRIAGGIGIPHRSNIDHNYLSSRAYVTVPLVIDKQRATRAQTIHSTATAVSDPGFRLEART